MEFFGSALVRNKRIQPASGRHPERRLGTAFEATSAAALCSLELTTEPQHVAGRSETQLSKRSAWKACLACTQLDSGDRCLVEPGVPFVGVPPHTVALG